jgi:DNA transposition AAA+ family ATPase
MANSVTRFVAKDQSPSAFCETPTATAIWNVLDRARRQMSLAAIIGAAGTGKTTTALAYAARHPDAHVIQASMRIRAPMQLVRELARLYGLQHVRVTSLFDEIVSVMSGFLIVDEAHFLADPAIELLRGLNDPLPGGNKIGIALIGNPVLIGAREGKNRPLHAQFLSRIEPYLYITAPITEDYDEFFDAHKISGARSRKLIQDAADRRGGALRTAAKIIACARELAADQAIGMNHIETSIEILGYGR